MHHVLSKKEAFCAEGRNPDRSVYLWLDEEKGAHRISGGTCEIPAGSEILFHSHETEEEVMFIYQGTGVALFGDEELPLEPETMVFVPPGVKHQFKNNGSEPLRFVFFYAPPGPEQAIRTIE